jgi:hypothetical protein
VKNKELTKRRLGMTTFNLNKFLSKIAKKGDVEHIDEQLRDDRGGDLDAPDTLTENQIDKDRKEVKETTTEEKLEKVRTGSNDSLVEGMLNSSKSKLHQHRNEDASAGDVNKLEEQRMANKNRQETEKQEPSSETGKKNRLLDNDTSKDDGLKLASWGWEFGKISKIVPKGSPEAMYYCKECGAVYDTAPSMTSGGNMCEKCGGINISDIPQSKGAITATPIPLNPSKPMPKLQSSQNKVVTSRLEWEYNDDMEAVDPTADYESRARDLMENDEVTTLSEDEDASVSGRALKELSNPAFDLKEDYTKVDFSEDEDEDDTPNFEEAVVGISKVTGTKMMTMEIKAIDTSSYEDELGNIDDDGKKRLITDVMAYLVSSYPEMKGLSSNMLNTSKINDGKVSYTIPA